MSGSLKVEFYRKEDGTSPVEEFLLSLDATQRAKTVWTIEALQLHGWKLREPYSKQLEDGIFELRAQVNSGNTRVLYFFISGNSAVLTNGFIKKTQKTPRSEIKLAIKYRADYERREEQQQ